MANQEHLDLLRQDKVVWNTWRREHPEIQPNLCEADLSKMDLRDVNLDGVDLRNANLSGADLRGANLRDAHLNGAFLSDINLRDAHLSGSFLNDAVLSNANLSRADLRDTHLIWTDLNSADLNEALLGGADLRDADLSGVDLRDAVLSEADLSGAHLSNANLSGALLDGAALNGADLSGAELSGADLSWTSLSEADLRGANLTGCSIYAISAWNVHLDDTIQSNLVITPPNEPIITVDNLEVAQFIYLLLNNQKIRNVINTITSKVVLILGRFTPKRKAILDILRDELREQNYLPVVFDFEQPSSRNLTETMSTLAHMSRFIIADLTSAKSIPQELERIVPRLRVPVQPLLHTSAKKPYAMSQDFEDYHWFLPLHRYKDQTMLLQSLRENVINPAERKAQELEKR